MFVENFQRGMRIMGGAMNGLLEGASISTLIKLIRNDIIQMKCSVADYCDEVKSGLFHLEKPDFIR